MRPIYESEADRKAQREIAALVAGVWGGVWTEMPQLHPFDFTVSRGGAVKAAVEVKDRKTRKGSAPYPTIYLEAPKYRALMEQGATPIFLVRLDGIVMWSDLSKIGEPLIIMCGRHDRGDPYDVSLCALIPRASFRVINVEASAVA